MDGARADGRTIRHQHRRPELLAAAVEYILEHGVAELSLRPMAEELGVTHATLLRHFGSREALVVEVVSTIREGVFTDLRAAVGDLAAAPLAVSMRTVWQRLCEPAQRRQFTLLFELVAMGTRDPQRFESLAAGIVNDFLTAMRVIFANRGMSEAHAEDVATGFLALVRGLQLDLAMSGDRRRVDRALDRYVDMITQPDLRVH